MERMEGSVEGSVYECICSQSSHTCGSCVALTVGKQREGYVRENKGMKGTQIGNRGRGVEVGNNGREKEGLSRKTSQRIEKT